MDANEYFVAHLWAWLQLGVVIARTYVFRHVPHNFNQKRSNGVKFNLPDC